MKTIGDFKIPQKGDLEATGWAAEQEANDTALAVVMAGKKDGSSVGTVHTRLIDNGTGTDLVFVKADNTQVVAANIDADGLLTSAAITSAQGDATQASADATQALADASQALADSSAAQADATQALADAGIAQVAAGQAQADATQALGDVAQAVADAGAATAAVAGLATSVATAFLDAADAEIGLDTGKTTFDEGRPNFEGTALTWEDLNFDPTMFTGGGSLPSKIALNGTTLSIAGFSGTGIDEVLFACEIPHQARLNAVGESTVMVQFHFHTYPTTSGATNRNIRMQLERIYTVEGAIVGSSITTAETFTLPATAWERKTFSFVEFPAPEKLGTQMFFRFTRLGSDPADTYASDLAIATVGLHYQIDAIGSRSITVK